MNLFIIGHSICGANLSNPDDHSFVKILFNKYNVPEQCLYSSTMCSEERILYFLKKQKDIDVAIIFHSEPQMFFIPGIERDFATVSSSSKFWLGPRWNRMNYLSSIVNDKKLSEEEWFNMHYRKINEDSHISIDEFKEAYDIYLKYFYTHDLNRNRHYGALMQIDQYTKAKQIPTIHCVMPKTLPTWFEFSHGIVDTDIAQFQHPTSNYYTAPFKGNSISKEGNDIIANTLSNYVDKLVGVSGI